MTEAAVTAYADPVTVLGEGRLYAAIRAALASATGPVIVVASDADDARPYPGVARRAAESGASWLPVRVEAGWALVGPAARPPLPGCPTCVERRRAGNRPDAVARDRLRARWGADLGSRPSALLTPLVTRAVAALVADEVRRLRRDPGSARTAGALLKVRLPNAEVRH
ncbi:TOMM precursor leader peptide-binding protein, partial [Nonomuraea ferruginea]